MVDAGRGPPYKDAIDMRTIRKCVFVLAPALVLVSPPARADGPVDYGQLGAILGYVAHDYATAVGPEGVLSAQEYAEQKGFLAEALAMARQLPPDEAQVVTLLSAAEVAAAAAAPPEAVAPKITEALAFLEQRHDLGTVPKQPPDFARGRQLFQEACVACHAAAGTGHTGLKLSTTPPNFTTRQGLGPLSPARVFAAVTYGVQGTAMPAFGPTYPELDRWNLAFYVLALGHAASPKAAAPARSLAELARESDDQLLQALTAEGARAPGGPPADPLAALAALRVDAPYHQASVAERAHLLAGARQLIGDALARARAGDLPGARHAAISAYLDNFEPFEAALCAKDAALTASLDSAFMAFRAAVDARAPVAELERQSADLERQLLKAEDAVATGSASVSFLASLTIALREGLEAALLLSAMLALAVKSGRARARLSVHLGWIGALLGGGATWFLSGAVINHGGQNRELTEGVTVLLTAVLLFGASHWVLAQASAKRLTSFLSEQASLVRGAGWGLGGLAFLAIYREMFEIVVFYRGLLLQSPGQTQAVALGLGVGLLTLAGVVFVFQRYVGRRLRPRPLLLTCGALMCLLSVVMVGEGVRSLQEAAVVGQHLVHFPELPQLGVFATAEGLGAQLLVIVALLASLGYSLLRAQPAPVPPAGASGARA